MATKKMLLTRKGHVALGFWVHSTGGQQGLWGLVVSLKTDGRFSTARLPPVSRTRALEPDSLHPRPRRLGPDVFTSCGALQQIAKTFEARLLHLKNGVKTREVNNMCPFL